jgi:hypothetical protein
MLRPAFSLDDNGYRAADRLVDDSPDLPVRERTDPASFFLLRFRHIKKPPVVNNPFEMSAELSVKSGQACIGGIYNGRQ